MDLFSIGNMKATTEVVGMVVGVFGAVCTGYTAFLKKAPDTRGLPDGKRYIGTVSSLNDTPSAVFFKLSFKTGTVPCVFFKGDGEFPKMKEKDMAMVVMAESQAKGSSRQVAAVRRISRSRGLAPYIFAAIALLGGALVVVSQ